ncbi:hypothetical protein [Aeromonas taiwanensis]|uniref:hypothetical protein n=1 Tax=Aeromonas taiwanensis TaxID=633417 RepID=UPI003BA1601D
MNTTDNAVEAPAAAEVDPKKAAIAAAIARAKAKKAAQAQGDGPVVAGETSVNTTDNAVEAPAAASEPAAEVDPKKAAIAAAIARAKAKKAAQAQGDGPVVAGETSVNTTDNAVEAPAAASGPAAEVDPKKAAIAAAIARAKAKKLAAEAASSPSTDKSH